MNHQVYSVAGLEIGLELPQPLKVTRQFQPFLEQDGLEQIRFCFEKVPALSPVGGRAITCDPNRCVYQGDGTFRKAYHDPLDREHTYALGEYDWETGCGTVRYEPEAEDRFDSSHGCFSHLGLEEVLMSRDRMILHASLVETALGGILFTGPSGIGKSTQAELWRQYEGGTVLNGDRPILYRNHGTWEAWGSPYAGSSGYYLNRKAPIRAIVLLEQGQTCELHRVSGRLAFCQLYGQLTFNSWNPRYVTKASSLLTELVGEVPVYHYCCTKEEEAVRVLKQALTGEASHD